MRAPVQRPPRLAPRMAVLLAYPTLAVCMAPEVIPSMTHRVVGHFHCSDLVGTAWTWWWTGFALAYGMNPANCAWTYFPVGFYPVAQFNLVDALLAAPLIQGFGLITGYNLAVLVMVASVGWAGHLLARSIGASTSPALFAGVALQTSSFIGIEVNDGLPSQAWIALLVVAVGLWYRLVRGDRGRILVAAAGGVSALTFLEYRYYGLFLAFAVAALTLAHARTLDRVRVVRLAALTAVTLAGVLPFVVLLFGPNSTLPGMNEAAGPASPFALSHGEAGLDWAMRTSLWPSWPFASTVSERSGFALAHVFFVVAMAPLLVLRRRRLCWGLVALVGWLITLGPYPRSQYGQIIAAFPLPHLWLHDWLPFYDRFWWPYRAVPLVLIGAAALAALNLEDLGRELGRWKPALALGATVALLVETGVRHTGKLPLMTSEPTNPSAAYAVVDGPAVTLPVFGSDYKEQAALWMQAWHHQPILDGLGGHIDGHRPTAIDALVRDNAFLHTLHVYEDSPPKRVDVPASAVTELFDLGFRFVVLDRATWSGIDAGGKQSLITQVVDAVLGAPVAQDGRTTVWRLLPPDHPTRLDPAPGWIRARK